MPRRAQHCLLFQAGQYAAAADAYRALFRIFDLREDGFHFTRSDPMAALGTDVDAMKENLFVAIAESDADPVHTAIEVSERTAYDGHNRFALLDAWQGRADLMAALEAALIAEAREPAGQDMLSHGMSRSTHLLRELYRRYRTLPDYEALCREIGPQQGWPYEDVVGRLREQGHWDQVLAWAEDGLARLPGTSRYRPLLQEAQGQALRRLGRPDDAFRAFRALFGQQRTVEVYLQLRDAARAIGRWEESYPQLATEMREYVLSETRKTSYAGAAVIVAGLLGFAYLLEGDWQAAVAWATDPAIPGAWYEEDVPRIVATGLLRMGIAARGQQPDDVLAQAMRDAPKIIREHGDLLEPVARSLPAHPVLDGAVQLYERLVERAIGGKNRDSYAVAAAYCNVIRSMRRVQGRAADFERYYQELLVTYSRYSALKDELRTAIEGRDYQKKRR